MHRIAAVTPMDERLPEHQQMTVEEFLAFADTRPDNESWELIEGVARSNASPTYFHQIIASNIVTLLSVYRKRKRASWRALIGIDTRVPVSPRSLPQPDAMVMLPSRENTHIAEEALLLFEVLSKSNTKTDQAWRRRVYSSVLKCEHYVVVDQFRSRIVRYDRASGWKPVELTLLDETLELPAIGAKLPLADIYDGTPVAPGDD